MSVDYPQFEELRRQKHLWLCMLWRVGDVAYYIGLIVIAMICPLVILANFWSWQGVFIAAGCVPVGLATTWLASNLKEFALKRGNVDKHY